jgi:hypothetical protein
MNKKKLSEDQEQAILCKWLKHNYPDVLFTVDLGGIRLNMGQRRIMQSRARRGHPDLMVQEWFLDKFCGLAIEFKKTGVKVSKKDGTLRKDQHLEEQLQYLVALRNRYWLAGFVCGVENAKAVIKAYLEASPQSLATINKFIYPKITLK